MVCDVVSSQPQHSMLWLAPEAEIFPLTRLNDISHIVWSPLAQGLLTGKYKPGEQAPADSRAASESMNEAMGIVMTDEALEAVQRLVPIAEDAGLSMVELALAWVLRRSELASAIIGASRPEQVHANAAPSGIELSQSTLEAIDEALVTPVMHMHCSPYEQVFMMSPHFCNYRITEICKTRTCSLIPGQRFTRGPGSHASEHCFCEGSYNRV